ncbi:hypothetical protein B0O99DRAFT_632973 [Bisporella sp. PMI_857]|nr:hypothetical protein B0O99DRAFT_632973 [Bisporella sp. PMI_857]
MPFDYNDYQNKVNGLSTEQLQKEWENYTRQIAGGATSTGAAILFSPLTAGISLVGLGLSTPRIHNARKKREIIERGLQARGATHNTRKRDVIAPMAISGVIAGATLGLAGPGADVLGGAAGEKGVEYLVAHAALDGTGAVIEHVHTEHEKKSAEHKLAMKMQNDYMQQQFAMQQQSLNPQMTAQPGYAGQPGYGMQQINPQFQPQLPGQPVPEPIYAPVPIPGAHSSSGYQPVAQQQQLVQQAIAPPMAQANVQNQVPYQPQAASYQPASHQQQYYQPASITQSPYQPEQPSHQPEMPPPPLQEAPQEALGSAIPQYQPETSTNEQITQSDATSRSENKIHLITIPTAFSAQAGPIPESYFSEKSPAYNANIQSTEQDECSTPAPAYSESQDMQSQDAGIEKIEMTMEEEIALLKARLLAMELEKRGVTIQPSENVIIQPKPMSVNESLSKKGGVAVAGAAVQASPAVTAPVRSMSVMQSLKPRGNVVVASSAVQFQAANAVQTVIQETVVAAGITSEPVEQNITPPPPPQTTSVLLPEGNLERKSLTTSQLQHATITTESQQQNTSPPQLVAASISSPPPAPVALSPTIPAQQPQQDYQIIQQPTPINITQQTSPSSQPEYQPQPTPASGTASPYASTYNPQNYPSLPSVQKPSYASQPGYQRHDSGYYSGAPTPNQQQYNSHAAPIMLHGRAGSVASIGTVGSPPPPYFPPPPGQITTEKDYFAGASQQNYPNYNQNQYQSQTYMPQQNYAQPATSAAYAPLQSYGQPTAGANYTSVQSYAQPTNQIPEQQWQNPHSAVPQQNMPYQGTHGWQWGSAGPAQVIHQTKTGIYQEPNYGPPPAVPVAWRGS